MNGYKVNSITYSEAVPWLLYKHYAKRVPSISYSFGLYREKILVGVCTFGSPASHTLCFGVAGEEYRKNVIELNRLCLQDNKKNEASYFISQCLKKLPGNWIVISYADNGKNHNGYIYQATNWLYTGASKERTDVYAGEGKHSRHHNGDKSIRQHRSSKHRYIYLKGDKRWKKKVKLNYEILDYPKGENINYDSGSKLQTQQLLF